MSVGFCGTVAELCSCGRKKQQWVQSKFWWVHDLYGDSLFLIWRIWWVHVQMSQTLSWEDKTCIQRKKLIEAQWEDTFSVFPLIFSSPQISGDLSSDPVLRKPRGDFPCNLQTSSFWSHLCFVCISTTGGSSFVCLALEPKEISALI